MRVPGFLLLSIALTGFIKAQEEPPLITDRPDQTESAAVVPAWRLQIESGISREWVSKGDDAYERNTRYGSTLLRFGMFDFMELRFGTEVVDNQVKLKSENPGSDFGISPIEVGFKFALVREKGLVPDIAVLTGWQIPNIGSEPLSSDKWQHSYVFAFAHTLSEKWGLGYNLGYEFEGIFKTSAFKYSLVGGYSITDWWGIFIEAYGGKVSKLSWDVRADTGYTFLLFPGFQLDLSGGIGLAKASSDGFISGGFSWRLPR